MSKFQLLLIERDPEMNEMFSNVLSESGYEIHAVFTGMDGLWAAEQKRYDAVLLDLMLPFKNGEEIFRQLRSRTDTPVLIFSAAKNAYKEIIRTNLAAEADGYLERPLNMEELVMGIEQVLWRGRECKNSSRILSFRDLSLDREVMRAAAGGHEVGLTAAEYRVLELFLESPDRIRFKRGLYELLNGEPGLPPDYSVGILISSLRRKLQDAGGADDYIEEIFHMGYRLRGEPSFYE